MFRIIKDIKLSHNRGGVDNLKVIHEYEVNTNLQYQFSVI